MNKKELELYIHIPFCVRKCSYCDFLSAPATEQTREAYMAALFAEIGGRAKDYSDRTVTSIFIGGGTPSLLSGEQIGQLMDRIREQFAMAQDAEITMEVNPGTASAEKLRNFYTAGINRLSIGMQSAQAEELKNLSERIFKTIVLKGKSGELYVCIIQVEDHLELKKVAKECREKSIELLPLSELEKNTGYIRGGCSPIGMKKKFPTYLDKKAEIFDKILVSAGKRGLQMELEVKDLIKISDAKTIKLI